MSTRFDSIDGRKRLGRTLTVALYLQGASNLLLFVNEGIAWSAPIGIWIIAGMPALWAALRIRDSVCATIGIASTLLALPSFVRMFQMARVPD